MAATWKKLLLIPLAASFMLAGCMESKEDIARKPDVVAQMVDNAASICEKGPVNGNDAQYRARLENVLQRVHTVNLEALQKNGITVCLDQRLDRQTTGFWNTRIHSVFHSDSKGGGTIAVYDNGTQPADTSIWHRDAYDWGGTAVDYFGDMVKDGEVTPQSGNWFAYTYTVSTGKNSSTHLGWRDAAHFDKDTQAKNPEIATQPPLLKPAPPKPAA